MALRTGLIGCGNISGIYLENNQYYESFLIVACADLDRAKAEEAAAKYNIPRVMEVDELLQSPDIDLILNLTIPHAHADVAVRAMEQKKHVYSEKPLAITLEDGKRILEKAAESGMTAGSAPDTFLGSSLQLAGKLIEEGAIGKPIGAAAFMMSRGPERWHPNPEFFYQAGGGPMYDMGPYYLTALVSLLGPVKRLTGSARITFPERTITSEARYGEKIPVQVPTHVTGILEFEQGAVATITTSFDVAAAKTPYIEIYGEKGTLSLPDPNHFHLPLLMKKTGEESWTEIVPETDLPKNARGIGLADMAEAIELGKAPRASSQLAYHVLEIMNGIHYSSAHGQHYQMESTLDKPALLANKEEMV